MAECTHLDENGHTRFRMAPEHPVGSGRSQRLCLDCGLLEHCAHDPRHPAWNQDEHFSEELHSRIHRDPSIARRLPGQPPDGTVVEITPARVPEGADPGVLYRGSVPLSDDAWEALDAHGGPWIIETLKAPVSA